MLAGAGCAGSTWEPGAGSRRDVQPLKPEGFRFEATRMSVLAEMTVGVMACWPPQVKLP